MKILDSLGINTTNQGASTGLNWNASKDGGKKVWVLRDGQPEAVQVKTGASDGKFTELRSDAIHPGQSVVIDSVSLKK